MRKTIFTLLLLTVFSVVFAQTKSYKDYTISYGAAKGEMQLNFTLDTFKVGEVELTGVKYSTIQFANGVNTSKKGFAELPMLNATLQLNNDNDVQIVVEEGKYIDIKLKNPMLPSRGTIYRQQDPKSIPYVIAPESKVDAWYPENIAEGTEPFIFRDTRGVNVYAYPFRYNAVTNTLRVYKSFKIIVKEDKAKSTNPLINKPSYIDPTVNDVYKSLYINYSESKFANQLGEFGEMLVIYTSRDASVIQPYIDWKRQKGFTVSTLQVATGTNVKTNIQNAYTSNPNLLYVQLVGDWADIKSDLGTTQSAPMDPYMGCVAGSDYYPELIIGRFSASTTAQVTIQVNKAINYEKNPDMSGTWYKNGLGIASSEGDGSGDDGEMDKTHMDYIKNNKLLAYTYTNVASQYQPSATASGVATSVNGGVSVINYCGHGSETTFVTSGYSNTNINASTNGNKLPFIFSVACVNGKFHMTSGDCFAEAWLRKENGGAVATIMSTINQPWIPPMRGQDYFNDILTGGYNYTANPGDGTNTTASDLRTTFGSITFNGTVLMLAEQYTNTDTRETFQTWTIFGDASLQVRTNTPKAIAVTAGNVTGSPYNVTVTSNGTALANARVALYQNGVSFTAITNSSGAASIAHNLTSGTATVTVTAYNYGTYQSAVSVGSSTTAPATPTGFASSNVSSNSFSLGWNASTGATSYDVQIRPQGGSWTTYNTTSTTYNATGLSASTTYEAQVSAKNSYGSSAYTSAITVTTATAGTAPATPTGLTSSNVTTNSASLAWTASSGATSYDIQIRPQGGTYSTYNVTTNSYNASGLTANSTYEWSVSAKNSYGSSSYATTVTFTTQNTSSGLSLPVSENFGTSTIPTGWSTQNTGTSITERWAVSNTNKAGGAAYEMKCTYQNVNPGTSRLITPAVNTVGVNQVTFSFKHMLDAYGTGATLRVQTSNDKTSWTNTNWSAATSSTNISAATVNITVTTNLNSETTYFAIVIDGNLYQIDYWYIDNVSITAGSEATVPTVTTTAISAITSSGATSGGNVTADGGATVTERGICYSTTSNPTTANSKVISGSGTGSFSTSISGLTANTTYYARAYATNSAGTAYGSQVNFTTLTDGGSLSDITIGTGTSTQGYPINCYYGYERSASIYTATEVGNAGSISKLAWYPTLTTTYNVPIKIYIKHTTSTTLSASTWATLTSGATLVYSGTMAGTTANAWKEFVLSTAFNYTGGSNNLMVLVETNYGSTGAGSSTGAKVRYTSATSKHLYIRADNSAPTGNGTVSSYRPNIKISITRSRVDDNSDNIPASNITISAYPNPTKDRITIDSNVDVKSIDIYSITGAKVYSKPFISNEIDLTDFQKGIYLVVLNDGAKRHTLRIVKQ